MMSTHHDHHTAPGPHPGAGAFDDSPFADVGPVDEELMALRAQRDDYLDALQRLKAEFDNHRRRTQRDADELRQVAAERLVSDLLVVLDTLDSAIQQGTELASVRDQMLAVLAGHHVERIDGRGMAFDPELHHAVIQETAGVADQAPVVIETLRAGYRMGSRVLRPAMVSVQS